jgi:hypothetical protein
MLSFSVLKFMDMNCLKVGDFRTCQYNTMSCRNQSVLCFTRHNTFFYFHRSQLSVLLSHALCFHRWITFFFHNVFDWRQIILYSLSIGYQGCVLVFLFSVFSFCLLVPCLWNNIVLCSPAAVVILVVTLGKWHVMLCYVVDTFFSYFCQVLSRSRHWGL